MSKLNFRTWWQIPRRAGEPMNDRRVSFLELFYDLVYVALIAQISHALAAHFSLHNIISYAFMFIILWWAWLNGTSYHDIHGNNDVRTRTFTFMQMIAVVGMAIFAHNATSEGSIGFAFSYAAFQLIMAILWWRTGVHDKDHRPVSIPHVISSIFTAILFIISAFIEPPLRFYLWTFAIIFSLFIPFTSLIVLRNKEEARIQNQLVSNISPSLIERFGLFTIIVLGEIVIGVVNGANHPFTLRMAIIAVEGTMLAIGIWWLYFDFISHHRPRKNAVAGYGWMYLHLFLTMSIAFLGAVIVNIIEHLYADPDPLTTWSLLTSLAIITICIGLLIPSLRIFERSPKVGRLGLIMLIATGIAILLLGLFNLSYVYLLGLAIVIMSIPGFVSMFFIYGKTTKSAANME